MATILTATYTTVDQGAQVMTGTLTFTGNYGTATSHGDVVNLATLAYQGLGLQVSPGVVPLMEFFETVPAGSLPSGYNFLYCPGTTLATSQIAIMNGLSEYTEGSAYNAALLGTTVSFLIFVPSL